MVVIGALDELVNDMVFGSVLVMLWITVFLTSVTL